MNETIKLLTNHRTYRQFDPNYQLPDEQLQGILAAARQAPSWMNGQAYSIIVIDDPAIREQLVAWNPGNPHIATSSVFLLFLADLNRTKKIADEKQTPYPIDEGLQPLLIATTDGSIALQSAAIAAESFGLGTVISGSVRKDSKAIAELLDLPEYVYPVAGLSIGKPIVEMALKPRLPQEAVIHHNKYEDYSYQAIERYDQTMTAFGEARETKPWSEKFAGFYGQVPDQGFDHFLKEQKLIE
jgi:FMN reductase [NAD(P)H]